MEAGRPPGNTGNTEASMAGWTLWWLAARLLARLVVGLERSCGRGGGRGMEASLKRCSVKELWWGSGVSGIRLMGKGRAGTMRGWGKVVLIR